LGHLFIFPQIRAKASHNTTMIIFTMHMHDSYIELRLMSTFTMKKPLPRIHTKVSVLRWCNATQDVIQSTSEVQTVRRHES